MSYKLKKKEAVKGPLKNARKAMLQIHSDFNFHIFFEVKHSCSFKGICLQMTLCGTLWAWKKVIKKGKRGMKRREQFYNVKREHFGQCVSYGFPFFSASSQFLLHWKKIIFAEISKYSFTYYSFTWLWMDVLLYDQLGAIFPVYKWLLPSWKAQSCGINI